MAADRGSTGRPLDVPPSVPSPVDAMYPDGKWKYRAETARSNPFVRSRHGGRVLSAFKLPFFLLHTPAGYGVLVTTGRKTGKPRRKCVRVIPHGDVAYLVSIGGGDAAWVKNLQATPKIRLRVGDRWYEGMASELQDLAELRTAREVYCQTIAPFDYATCSMHRRGRPSRAKIVELTTAWFDGGLPLAIHCHRQDGTVVER